MGSWAMLKSSGLWGESAWLVRGTVVSASASELGGSIMGGLLVMPAWRGVMVITVVRAKESDRIVQDRERATVATVTLENKVMLCVLICFNRRCHSCLWINRPPCTKH